MDKKIYIWGTGRLVGKVLGVHMNINNITGFIDNNESITTHMDKPVLNPNKLKTIDFDAVIVINSYANRIEEQSIELGLDTTKFIYVYSNFNLVDKNKNYKFVNEILGEELSTIIQKRYELIRCIDLKKSSLITPPPTIFQAFGTISA